jgi:hypothetical protein
MRNFFFSLFSIALLPLSLVSAQNAVPGARQVQLRLLSFYSESAMPELYAHNAQNPDKGVGILTPLKNYLNHESVTVSLTSDSMLFTASAQAPKPDQVLAKVTLPAKGTQFMLVFFPGETKGSFRVMALDDSRKAFPLGSFRVMNLARSNVRLTLETTNYDFTPGKEIIIEDPPVKDNNHSGMYCFAQISGKWERIGSGLWPHPGTKRDVQFFFENPQTKLIELRGFRDISPPSATPPPVVTP